MSGVTRRQVLTAAALGVSSSMLSRLASAAPAKNRPRVLVHILLRGGMDAMLSTDPKLRRELEPRIPLPCSESDIRIKDGFRYGPMLRDFEPFFSRMAIVNGNLCSTVSHPAGEKNTHEMRRLYPVEACIGLAGTIGSTLRTDEPVDDIRIDLNGDHLRGLSPVTQSLILREVGERGPLQTLHRLAQTGARSETITRLLEDQASRCGPGASCAALAAVRDLYRRMPKDAMPAIPDLTARQPDVEPMISDTSAGLWRDVLFMLRHRMARGIFIVPHFVMWDSHQYNTEWQLKSMQVFGPAFAWFMEQLSVQRTAGGTLLADEVGIVVSSELGRFPIPNELKGKDHLPEFPALFFGPGIRPGQYGQTDKSMLSTPIGLVSGHSGSSTRTVIPTIDDLGATILHWFGIEDTTSVGYIGRRLDFLLA